MQWKYFTAEGMRDQLPEELYSRRKLEESLRQLFWTSGYEEVETPEIEFGDVYLTDRFVPQESLYKLQDPQGRILAMRFDNTVPIMRMAATSGRNLPLPLRVSYLGTMFRQNLPRGGQSHQFEQAGIECIGPKSPRADGEVIQIAIESMLALGLRDFQLSLNNIGFYKALAEEFSLTAEVAEVLPGVIDGKEFVRLESLLTSDQVPDEMSKILTTMMEETGSWEVLQAVRPLTENRRALAALDEIEQILTYLRTAGLDQYVALDLGLLSNLQYYTGTIFRGYAAGVGSSLLSGGRYDEIGRAFGRDLPATGFSLDLTLAYEAVCKAEALTPDTRTRCRLFYRPGKEEQAFLWAKEQRGRGIQVTMQEWEPTQDQPQGSRLILPGVWCLEVGGNL